MSEDGFDTSSALGGAWFNLRTKADGVLEGAIIDMETREKTFEGQVVLNRKTNKPRVEWVFTLQTTPDPDDPEDDGVRKASFNESAQRAIAQAQRDSGERLMRKGGTLKIAVKVDPADSRSQAEYQARYTPPAPAATAPPADDPFGDDEPPF